jgi:hypothetical protein
MRARTAADSIRDSMKPNPAEIELLRDARVPTQTCSRPADRAWVLQIVGSKKCR